MKKSLMALLLILLLPSLGYSITNDALRYWSNAMNTTKPADPLGGWTCTGSGKTAKDVTIGESGINLRSLFPDGSPAYLPLDFEDYGIVYVSNSSTEEGGKADEWLISPEFDLSGAPEHLILSFDVFAYGNSNDPLFGVYASAGGDKREDFTTKLYSGKTTNGENVPAYKRVYIPVSNISNDKVRIAFVNMSRNAMLLGFRNVEICEYQLDVQNHLGSYYETAQDLSVDIDVDIRTPVACDGFKAVLTTSDGKEQEYSTSKPVGSAYTHVSFSFPDKFHIENGDQFSYTLSITPNYEGATTSTFEYDMVCNDGFESVCVLEELTGSWCMWCPRGAAALGYFSDKYNDRFIGIAVHASDPMEVPKYINALKDQSGLQTFPNGWFSRRVSEDPWNPEVVEQILAERSGYTVAIKEVDYNEANNGLMTVKYAPKVAFNSKSQDITAVVVVTEDKVKGTNARWNQVNAYANRTKESIEESFGEGTWPYFKLFGESGDVVPYQDMTYDHVAVGVWNSYLGGGEGAVLPKEWIANTEQEFTISFELPKRTSDSNDPGVMDWKNTHVIVLLLDRGSGKVLGAAKMGADDYKDISAVKEVTSDHGVKVERNGNNVVVVTPTDAKVSFYNANGFMINTESVKSGTTEIAAYNLKGLVMVSVVEGNSTYVKKLIF